MNSEQLLDKSQEVHAGIKEGRYGTTMPMLLANEYASAQCQALVSEIKQNMVKGVFVRQDSPEVFIPKNGPLCWDTREIDTRIDTIAAPYVGGKK